MELFVCSSAYQLLNAINIVVTYNIDADVILIRKELETICDIGILEDSRVFKNIYKWFDLAEKLSDHTNNSVEYFFDKLKKINIYLNKKAIYNSIPIKDKKYDRVNIAYADYPSQCIYYYFKSSNTELSFYEDGTYTYEFLAVRTSLKRKLISKMLFHSFIFDDIITVYVRNISKFNYGNYKNIRIKTIHKCSDEKKNDLLRIFKGKKEDIENLDRSIIYFDQNIEYESVRNLMVKLANDINLKYGNEHTVVKLHPASLNMEEYSESINIVSSRLPFELIIEEINMTEKVLISIFSTTCFSPKFIMDAEPYVIFTYKALGFDKVGWFNEEFTNLIQKLKDSYNNKEKVIVPETYEEILLTLDKIKKKDN